MDGDITRETVTEALRGMDPIENPMVGTPYAFGTQNTAGWPIVLESGTNAWEKVADDWLRIGE